MNENCVCHEKKVAPEMEFAAKVNDELMNSFGFQAQNDFLRSIIAGIRDSRLKILRDSEEKLEIVRQSLDDLVKLKEMF